MQFSIPKPTSCTGWYLNTDNLFTCKTKNAFTAIHIISMKMMSLQKKIKTEINCQQMSRNIFSASFENHCKNTLNLSCSIEMILALLVPQCSPDFGCTIWHITAVYLMLLKCWCTIAATVWDGDAGARSMSSDKRRQQQQQQRYQPL